ncbi:hypothetical protein [uncultured Psychromonas sp.]|uniref:hypothetical protein n=1 Tax=uncultured Psychromonas sp. TaxID=173974 RepID=UPI002628ADEB|nr:hypothetical protein [uncultured Psychromonas sp.]
MKDNAHICLNILFKSAVFGIVGLEGVFSTIALDEKVVLEYIQNQGKYDQY